MALQYPQQTPDSRIANLIYTLRQRALTKPTLAVDVLYLSPNDRRRMLRLTILESPAEQRFVVEGKLMQPWVSELESAWESARDARRGRRCVVDLSDTTGIDRSGRRLLMAMCGEGVRFIAKGVYVRHLIKHLRRNGAKQQAPCLSQDETEETH